MFRASQKTKERIANSIIDFMNGKSPLLPEVKTFIVNWVMTGPEEKSKAYFDIWAIVLKNYLPEERPVLFRSCTRLSKRPIQCFTGRIRCAERFSDGHGGHVLVCDTKEYLQFETEDTEHKHSFFSVYDLVRRDLASENPQFTQKFYDDYSGEDEYIVCVDLDWMYDLKWNR